MSIYLGIDPGTTTIGFAIIKKEGAKLDILDYGIIDTQTTTNLGSKLVQIYEDINSLIDMYSPNYAGIETLFFTNNAKTAIQVAEARGILELALTQKGIAYSELSPPEIKKGICGNGRANKKQVQNVVKTIFKLKEIPKPDDAADALAIAYLVSLIK